MMWTPGDWMSRSTTATVRPCCASSVATLAVVFDLPVPPRNEWTEISCAIARAYTALLGVAQPEALRLLLQIAEVVGVGDLFDLPGRLRLVDLDLQRLHLRLQASLALVDLARHPL